MKLRTFQLFLPGYTPFSKLTLSWGEFLSSSFSFCSCCSFIFSLVCSF